MASYIGNSQRYAAIYAVLILAAGGGGMAYILKSRAPARADHEQGVGGPADAGQERPRDLSAGEQPEAPTAEQDQELSREERKRRMMIRRLIARRTLRERRKKLNRAQRKKRRADKARLLLNRSGGGASRVIRSSGRSRTARRPGGASRSSLRGTAITMFMSPT